MTLLMPGSPKRLFSTVLCGGVFGAVILWLYAGSASPSHPFYASSTSVSNEFLSSSSSDGIVNPVAKYFINYPLSGPNYGEQFGELGQRVQIVTKWISAFASSPSSETTSPTIDEVVLSMFPFLQNPSDATDKTPFTSLRRSFVSRSRGIVIPTGINNFRFTCHLILTIRTVLHSKLPIQIAFAGDADLPLEKRDILRKLDKDVEFLNVPSILDKSTL
jgi:alpha 1,3-mannosyltransferase